MHEPKTKKDAINAMYDISRKWRKCLLEMQRNLRMIK